ncbi:hypothetical protein SEA_LEOPARD_28 [Mycobacterium phage Leopard]|uniref:SAP domain-containing protein n=1 Tax=Mycobacterium phage Onyinye TaxID=2686235 RepID=A0A6B9LFA3_9CAUD|nr:hypothetical protein PP339_gp029 [Mycobacterium phage Onyinye]QHB37435.1 hypothetical protein SEA_ONYINYE_29 [Mycobacterium phage Onyinye]UOW92906.1 hypothetical protein SEA_LEOPARD_28 [Mycobacterium phage Leopard]WKW85190.1 hypothetical protein SEA_AIKOY__28 [Mycobacterium phage Aikoy]
MSMQVDHSRPLTKEEKVWLHQWSLDWVIEENERIHGKQGDGEPPNVQAALEDAGFKAPPPPPGPTTVAGQGTVLTGPVVVEGENDQPPAPGTIGTRVELPRDHPLTAAIDDSTPAGGQQAAEADEWDAKAVRAEVNELTVDELKENLRELDEPVSGDKAELQKRLFNALKKAHEAS